MDRLISYFPKLVGDVPPSAHITVYQALQAIKDGRWKSEIQKLRACKTKAERNPIKKDLPLFTFSCKILDGKKRASANVEMHSGFICLDFDDIDVGEKMAQLFVDDYIFAAFVSPSGNGVKALVKIPSSDQEASFRALKERYPLLDHQCKDIARACYVSYDPDLWINDNSKMFLEQIRYEDTIKYEDANPTEYSKEAYDLIVSWAENKNEYFAEGNRNDYVHKLSCNACEKAINKSDFISLILNDISIDKSFTLSEFNKAVDSAYSKCAFGKHAYEQRKKKVTVVEKIKSIVSHQEPTTSTEIIQPSPVVILNPSVEIPKPCYTIKILGKAGEEYDLSYDGNLGAVSGAAKSMKSTLLFGLKLSFLSGHDSLNIRTRLKDRSCLWVDTEQDHFLIKEKQETLWAMSGLRKGEHTDRMKIAMMVDEKDKSKRFARMVEEMKTMKNLGLVIIDGIVDMCKNYNDYDESSTLVDALLSLANQYKVTIVTVIHIAKTSGSMRGHLGTELLNKADWVIKTEKESKEMDATSKIICDASRGRGFPEYYIGYSLETGRPQVVDDPEIQAGNGDFQYGHFNR